ncbi:uncharacterized protein YbjQ (UPF0145 family) [Salirhabdus euzebyi]|uniref:UPF0145 protein HNQ94_002528 n=1 Tax=Salirhabdus euzebyi TaxID=394506 RepID=A0A841Q6Y1_9BACI|nr:YbjQ family protein [Salirhabdus euzebyi]MBB6454077.1 uncharacterized protein YbjQ (UPF0145 family) [Salirhabdus euzebyi]
MIISTGEHVPGYEIKEVKGPAVGLTVRARGLGKDITASIKGLMGGEIKQYAEMLEEARKEAMDRMTANAQQMGADAIIAFRFDSGNISSNMSEIVAYGTAVTLEKKQ